MSICQNGYSGCVSLYVQVSGSNNSISGSLSFGTANPVLTIGQSQSDTIYPPNGNSNGFYISSNSNSNAVSTTISGSTLTMFGQNTGTATIKVCSNDNSYCGNVYATVNGYSGGVTFSQSTVNLNLNQNSSITVSGGTGSYVLTSNTGPNVVAASLTGSTLYLNALNNGSATITVCQSGNTSACGQVIVTVGGSSNGNNIITFSNSSPAVAVGQSQTVTVYTTNGWTGNYSVTSNSNSNAATVSVTGTSINITGIQNGSTIITVCQTGSSVCGTLTATIGTGATSSPVTFATTGLPAGTVGLSYGYQLQAQGGAGSYTYFLPSGSLPAGITLSTGGLIQGIPTATGTTSFTLQVTDSGGTSQNLNFSITVNPASPSATTPQAAGNGTYTNGQLINENGTISIVYKNTKTPFANAAAFLGLGFKFSDVWRSAIPACRFPIK